MDKAHFTDSQWIAATNVAADMYQHGGSLRFNIGDELRCTKTSAYRRDNWVEWSEPLTEEVLELARAIAPLIPEWDVLCKAKVERKRALAALRARG